jgi:hypothetical protein
MICGKTKMSLVCLFSTLSFLTLSWTAVHAQVTLTVGKGSALPGATESPVAVSLDNPENNIASGMTMTICDASNFLSCTACETTDRTEDFSCSVNELDETEVTDPLKVGCCKVALLSFSSADIETGTGPIFTLLSNVSSSASGQTCKELRILDDVQIADASSGQQLSVDLQSGGFCFPCASDADCDDGLYCTGEESCTGDACVLDANPCSESTMCVEGTGGYDCIAPPTTTTSGPSSTTTTGPSTTTTTTDSTTTTGPSSTTTTVSGDASIEVMSDNFWKSRWVALPSLVVIKGNETSFQPFKTTVAYDPRDAIFKLFPIILGNDYIWNIVLIMPGWFAGTGDQEVTVTVTTGDEIVSDDFLIQELPFILEQK